MLVVGDGNGVILPRNVGNSFLALAGGLVSTSGKELDHDERRYCENNPPPSLFRKGTREGRRDHNKQSLPSAPVHGVWADLVPELAGRWSIAVRVLEVSERL
jgi:hypothetical protein